MGMENLRVNKHCDHIHDIKWVSENIKKCFIDRNYKERHEPTISGVSISVQFGDDVYCSEYAANDEGWMYVSDRPVDGLPEVNIMDGIAEVEASVNKWLKDNGY